MRDANKSHANRDPNRKQENITPKVTKIEKSNNMPNKDNIQKIEQTRVIALDHA